ncbi:terminase family protein [Acinetobacter nosocomialis]|uniref:terminase large subunit domain-containing protein n=1 Tax=Acinetobacter nosocomialis TaxID=106654 RepID=UPI001AE64EE8|nr:terminase family protein [Acinetobacter nosocomialis]MBP1501781.1 terminase family protein [Acinetobacter nosocomialis]MDE1706137.1 terminase family protein [Acinetobacter nosocomialis]HDG9765172.1 terminase family protein [Acinetobacter nosocomialis]
MKTETEIPPLTFDNRLLAKFLYWMGWRISSIAEYLKEKDKNVHAWKARDGWDEQAPEGRVAQALEAQLVKLIILEKKTPGDFKEIDLLMRQLERMAKINKYNNGGNETDLNPNLKNRTAGPRKPTAKNVLTEEQIEKLLEDFDEGLFEYQKVWYRAREQRNRALLKSRQIGATFYFAREALIKAVTTGRNQIFLSASKAQAHGFKTYIKDFVLQSIGVDLQGDPITITLPTNETVQLIFLSTNAKTAQSYHGDLYFDEFFWVHGFATLKKVASAMAAQKQYKKTYFSTPSSKSHEAYKFWTGEAFNKGRSKDKQVEIDTSHDALRNGALCNDQMWRHIVNIYDAERQGCNLFDIDELIAENSADEFANLYMCEFVDDGQSVFPLSIIQPCMVDSWELWTKDFKPLATRPFGNKPVWVGYDPAESGDSAGLVIVAPPESGYNKFRLLEHHQFKGMDFASQAAFIKKICQKYRVAYIGMDKSGMGTGIAQLVQEFFPNLTTFTYSIDVKTQLVMKGMDVLNKGRFEFDAGATEVAQSLMAIKKTLTASQKQMTFEASRAENIGHADLAFAIFHAFFNEPLSLENDGNSKKSTMEIY